MENWFRLLPFKCVYVNLPPPQKRARGCVSGGGLYAGGMQPGEKRRALIPPAVGYVTKGMAPQPPEFGQKRQVETHAGEPLVFEVKLIKVRSKA